MLLDLYSRDSRWSAFCAYNQLQNSPPYSIPALTPVVELSGWTASTPTPNPHSYPMPLAFSHALSRIHRAHRRLLSCWPCCCVKFQSTKL